MTNQEDSGTNLSKPSKPSVTFVEQQDIKNDKHLPNGKGDAEPVKQNGGQLADENSESPDGRVVDGNIKSKDEEGKTPENEALLSIEVSQSEGWVPDGGWGWAIVVGGVIVHVYVGKDLYVYTL
jgi:hypothetical protein